MANEKDRILKKEPKIYQKYKPSDEEKRVHDWVYDRYETMKSSQDRLDAQKVWETSRTQWEAKRIRKEHMAEWQSDHYVPLTTAIVETALAEMTDQSLRPLILPRGSEDAPRSMVMSNTFTYTWEISNGDSELYNVEKDALICGTAIAQEYYFKDRRLIQNLKTEVDGKEKYEEVEVFDYDDCYMETVRLEDFFVDEKARDFVGPYAARDCIRRYIMDIEDFKLFFNGETWNPMDRVKLVQPGGDVEYYDRYKPPEGINKENEVEVLWYWSRKPFDALYIVANDIVIKMGPNIYKHKQLPYARAVDVKRPHSFYGKGEAELLESTNNEINTLRRMIIDRNHLDIFKMFFIPNTMTLNDEDLIARPSGAIPVDDPNAAKAIEYGDIPRSVDMSIKLLTDDSTIATGIDPRSASLPSPGTATEAAILKESALKRIRMKMRGLERDFLIQIARLRVSNIIQFYSQPKLEKIVGEADTQEFKQQVADLRSRGLLEVVGGKAYEKQFRSIRLEDKKIDIDVSGNPVEKPASGVNFFELRPDYFVPIYGSYDIKFSAGSSLPISKPLMQSKAMEMYDRLIQLAISGVAYDPAKLGDYLLKVNDLNPQDFKVQEQTDQVVTEDRAVASAELATIENEQMMQGQPIPSTAYSSPVHTQIHTEFMNSPAFQEIPPEDPINQIFADHVMGEIMAQSGRGAEGQSAQGGQLPPRPQSQVPPEAGRKKLVGDQSGGNRQLQDTLPSLIQGGGMVPKGI